MDDHRVLNIIKLVYDLVLALKVDRCAHQDKRCVKSILIAALWGQSQVLEARCNDSILDALIFTFVVDAHVTNCTQAKLSNLGELVLESLTDLLFSDQSVELLDSVTTQQCLDTLIAKCDVDESFEEMGQVLRLIVLNVLWLRVTDERQDHELRDTALDKSLAAIFIDSESVQGP